MRHPTPTHSGQVWLLARHDSAVANVVDITFEVAGFTAGGVVDWVDLATLTAFAGAQPYPPDNR